MDALDLRSTRARHARMGRLLGRTGYITLLLLSLLLLGAGILLIFAHLHYGYSLIGLAILCFLPAEWWKRDLSVVPPRPTGPLNDRLDVSVLTRLNPRTSYAPDS